MWKLDQIFVHLLYGKLFPFQSSVGISTLLLSIQQGILNHVYHLYLLQFISQGGLSTNWVSNQTKLELLLQDFIWYVPVMKGQLWDWV